MIAAAILASALGALAWALSQIGLVVAAATSIVGAFTVAITPTAGINTQLR